MIKPDYVSKTNIAQKILVKEFVKRDTKYKILYFHIYFTKHSFKHFPRDNEGNEYMSTHMPHV